MTNPVNLVDPSGQNPLLILAAVSFLAGVGVNTWMQYQANHGWCGFDPLAALEWGISAAFISTLAALTAIEALALLGMGLQGIGVLINWLPAFSAGSSLSATAGAAAAWFMTGLKPRATPSTVPSTGAPTNRTGLRSKMGSSPPNIQNPQAHHNLPWRFREWFAGSGRGLNVNDPRFGRWVQGTPPGTHQNWSRMYDQEFQEFISQNPNALRDEVLDFLDQLLSSGMFP